MNDIVAVFLICAATAVGLVLLYVLSTICRRGHPGLESLSKWSYCHRGLYGPGVPENSYPAFQQAVDHGYGVELDVHLLADGNLAVIHDFQLERMTDGTGRVENLTTEQISKLRLKGSDQPVALFPQVLEIFSGKTPIIVELKSTKDNYAELCRRTCLLLDTYEGEYCLESFDPRCVLWLRRNRPKLLRGQLVENYFRRSKTMPCLARFIMVHQMLNFLTFPDFVAYRFPDRKTVSNVVVEKLWGVKSVAWTLQTREEYDTAVKEGRIPIFEGFEP